MAPGRRPTLKDVARLAEVSHQTVSRFVSGDPAIRQANRDRIQAAIDELGYRPNIVARSMRMRRKGLLSVVAPATTAPHTPAKMMSATTAEAHAFGYEVEVVHVAGGASARTNRALELADSGWVEGVLSLATFDERVGPGTRPGGVPIIEFAVYDDQLHGAGIMLDASPMIEIVGRLAELGHRDFFHVGGPVGHPASDERFAVYDRAVSARGLTSHGSARGPFDGSTGVEAIEALPIDSPVTAVVCANDELAAGVLLGASRRGWSVPGRLSVTGWDNRQVGKYMPPGLTTVIVDHETVGRTAMGTLIAALRGEPAPVADFRELNTVVWRGSVGPRP
ncbi:LacI family transcriptional regulator [Microbacterium sorbitolivorans]|uniref:LacI family transcriptional regulator n=2 Tax=Microbacterium sorbitolivorans TaxID=1867410 RepID=A0A367Y8I4_9MICO|nr:LacI family transcriptional regulator [Microbacterium sorbitolivorans]